MWEPELEDSSPLVAAMGEEGVLVEPRLRRGCRAFVACDASGVAGYAWLSAGPEWIGELGREIRPAPGEAYVWNCVTLPDRRRRGVFRHLLAGVVAVARSEGRRRLWIGSDGRAEGSVAAAGFAPALQVELHVLPGLWWLRLRPAPGADEALVAGARRALGAGAHALVRPRRRRH